MFSFYSDKLVHEGVRHILSRGTARILEETRSEIFLCDTTSGAHMLVTDDFDKARYWLRRHKATCNYSLMAVFNERIATFVKDDFNLRHDMVCRQAVYQKKLPPASQSLLATRKATISDFSLIWKHYQVISAEEIRNVVLRGNMLIGEVDSEPVGFIGEHLEGSMGMLMVFPEQRHKGYGHDLEAAMITKILAENRTPYAQVETDNLPSVRLQEKIGMTISRDLLYWLY